MSDTTNTHLHKFVEEGNIKAVMEIIKPGGRHMAAVNTPNDQRVFPLHVAAQTGNVSMTELLLKHNAKVGCIDGKGLTPLHYAARAGHKETVLALLKQNAQVDCQGTEFWTPLHYATYYRHTEIVSILCEAKANLEESDLKGQTPLHVACKHGYKEIIHILLSCGARVEGRDHESVTPIELLQLKKPLNSPQYSESSNYEMLSKDMKALLYNPEFSDITFVFDAPTLEKVPAHRNILKARAPALLKDASPDSGRNQSIRLPGMSAAAFRLMLEWVYTATIEIEEVDLEVAIELYNKAEDFKLPRLRIFVENVITSNIDETTTKTVLDVAISFKATPIIDKCSIYIVENFNKISTFLKNTQQPMFTKDEFLEIIQHLDITESPPPDVATDMDLVAAPEAPALNEPSASFNNAGGSLKVKIQRPAASRTVARTTSKKATQRTASTPPASSQAVPAVTSEPPISATPSITASETSESASSDKKGANEAKKMAGKALELSKQLVKDLMEDPRAPDFNSPVDHVGLKLPDYPLIIKQPMDLGTITKNLKSMPKKRHYKTLKDFSADVRLVFDNARVYNMNGSPIYDAAEGLAQLFEQKYIVLKKTLGINKQYDLPKPFQPALQQGGEVEHPAPPTTARSPPVTAVARRGNNTTAVSQNVNTVDSGKKNVKRRLPKSQTPPASQRSPAPPAGNPPGATARAASHRSDRATTVETRAIEKTSTMAVERAQKKRKFEAISPNEPSSSMDVISRQDKTQLHHQLANLNEWAMGRVLQIIKPNSSMAGETEMEIDLDALPPATIRKLQKFVETNAHRIGDPATGSEPALDPEDEYNDPDF